MRPLESLVNSGRKQLRDKTAIVGLHMTEFKQESCSRASAESTSWTGAPHGSWADIHVCAGTGPDGRSHGGRRQRPHMQTPQFTVPPAAGRKGGSAEAARS